MSHDSFGMLQLNVAVAALQSLGLQRRHGLDCLRCRLVRATPCQQPSAWLHVQQELIERHAAGPVHFQLLQLLPTSSFV